MIRSHACLLMAILILASWGCNRSDREPRKEAELDPHSESILQPYDDARTVLEKAAKAAGGEGASARWRCGSVKFSMSLPGGDCVTEETFQLPGQFKRVVVGKEGAVDHSLVFVLDKGKWWSKKDQAPAERLEVVVPEKTEHQFAEVTRVPQVAENGQQLIEPHGLQIDGHAVIGVRVRRGELDPVDCFFSTETGLMLEIRKTVPGDDPDKPAVITTHLSHYKNFQGCMVPTRIKGEKDGTVFLDVSIIGVKFEQRIDDSVFAKP